MRCDYFVWNSEVGKRTVGVQSFWFQSCCANHIVWDAADINQVERRHTGRVRNALADIRSVIEQLVAKRDERKNSFATVVAKAMETKYGQDAEETQKLLTKAGFTQALAKRATELASEQGRLTIWSVVDALTRLARESQFAGNRTEADQKAASLLSLAVA